MCPTFCRRKSDATPITHFSVKLDVNIRFGVLLDDCQKTTVRTPTERCVLEIQILDIQRIILNEFTPRLDDIAHQLSEQIVCVGHVFNFYLQ